MNVETRLSPYFSAIPETDIPDVLQPVARLRDGFGASTLRVVVFGGARNGKSSLINALSGAEMLPVHSLGPGHPIVELRHDTDPRASIVRADGTEAEVSIDEGRRIARGIVEAVTRITMWAPFPFLSDNVALVDTPPLTGGDGADEWAIMTELESADIALMVLSADKILSRSERELARRAGRLLGDNMWFVVNRIDLVEESELDEVMAWAAGGLTTIALRHADQAVIIPTSAKESAGTGGTGVARLAALLHELTAPENRRRIEAQSRLGVLHRVLEETHERIAAREAAAAELAGTLRERQNEASRKEQGRVRQAITTARLELAALEQRLPRLGTQFVEQCVADTVAQPRAQTAGPRLLTVQPALAAYVDALNRDVRRALAGVPVTVPKLDLSTWIFRIEIPSQADLAGKRGAEVGERVTQAFDGGRLGRQVGGAIGDWIGHAVPQPPNEAQAAREKLEAIAHEALPGVEQEARRHLAGVEALLGKVERDYRSWVAPSPDLDAAQEDVRYWSALERWCLEFLQATEAEMER